MPIKATNIISNIEIIILGAFFSSLLKKLIISWNDPANYSEIIKKETD